MRQILVDHAKRHRAAKRGSGNKMSLEEAGAPIGAAVQQLQQVDLIALNDALDKLAQLDARQSQIVELRFFGGLTEEEIAEALDVSPVTVRRDWRMAKAVLHNQLGQGVLY